MVEALSVSGIPVGALGTLVSLAVLVVGTHAKGPEVATEG